MAVAVQPECRREAKGPTGRKIPREARRQIVRCVVQAEAPAVAESAVHFHTRNEMLQAEVAAVRRSLQRQRAARAERIAKFPRVVRQIFRRDRVLCCRAMEFGTA